MKIGITHGDHNGVGYEVILKALADRRMLELFTPIIYGCSEVWHFYKERLRLKIGAPLRVVESPEQAQPSAINLIETDTSGVEVVVEPGVESRLAGTLAARALFVARNDLLAEKLDAVVTAPIQKHTIQSSDFAFHGHTEFFNEPFPEYDTTMLFVANELRVGLVTMHTPLSEVSHQITLPMMTKSILGLEQTLIQDFGLEKPKIAVLGLNPHSGENGLLGREEEEVIKPAVRQAWESGHYVFGPFPADGYWGSGSFRSFDATLALYHDQGLIPFKLIALEEGVNVTAGLPIIRTSPDHGTAFDIAGKGVASEVSLRNAIYQAIDIHRHRTRYREAARNPLQKKFVERGRDNVKLDLSKSVDEE